MEILDALPPISFLASAISFDKILLPMSKLPAGSFGEIG
jgi:hypothetical protein